jgi:rRNA maturation endonuclease Nob1
MSDYYAECHGCGKLYPVIEGHDCEYGTHVPPVDFVRTTIEDEEGNEVEIRTENA